MDAAMEFPWGSLAGEHHHDRAARRRAMAMMTASRKHGRQHGHGHGHGRGFGPGMGPLGGPGGFPGPFFGRGPKVGRGDVRDAILVLLAEEPMYGYQVIQELSERSGGVWRPSPGSIYPTLQQMEEEGLVASEETGGRRVFHLTEAGTKKVAKRGENVPAPWEMRGDAGPLIELREVGFGLVQAVLQVAHTGSAQQVARAKQILTEARKGLYRLLAEDEPENEEDDTSAS